MLINKDCIVVFIINILKNETTVQNLTEADYNDFQLWEASHITA